MSFKDISYLELLRPFCSFERNIFFSILVEGIMRNNSMTLFQFGPVVHAGGDVAC